MCVHCVCVKLIIKKRSPTAEQLRRLDYCLTNTHKRKTKGKQKKKKKK